MSVKHPVERGTPGKRGVFDHVAETGSNFASSGVFFALCVALVAVSLVGHVSGEVDSDALHGVGDAMAALTLLLAALLKNAELRSEHAVQSKLDAIAAAMLDENPTSDARQQLREAIGMEEEV